MHEKHTWHAPCCPANSRENIKSGEKTHENLRSGSTETYLVEALCSQGAQAA